MMRFAFTVTAMLLLYPFSTPIWAGEKIVTSEWIDEVQRTEGAVSILLPCNWDKSKPVKIEGIYGEQQEVRPMPNTSGSAAGLYIIVTVNEQDQADLKWMRVEFAETNKRCEDDFGWGNFTR